ncbi:MAG: sigma-54-dependent Fis family transcriptional regulator [Phaeodactylibacter sp.]|nr:sigma-54-dependent Fis family transcriptional regulator [Phaeodactylibacter sp.]MCB9273643.1 sigma-54-dependent Fis family transcriptional regulator [Lewinellaceae bacterium]
MKKQGTILVVDDDEDINLTLNLLLRQHYKSIFTEENPYHLPRLLRQYEPDVVLLDMNFSKGRSDGEEGLSWLRKIKELSPDVQVIMITAYGDVPKVVEAIKAGAADFVEKPWRNEKLLATIHAVFALSQARAKLSEARTLQSAMSEAMGQPFNDVVGQSEAMQSVLRTVEKVAATDANVLILGENGVGKEVIARAIHRQSHRAKEVFVPVDMGAIPESLCESELFGHKKGAFTGAVENRVGRFQMAHGGTLFLDEIGNIPISMQPKLLQALQSLTITPVGSDRSNKVDIRLISATNQPLRELIGQGRFREDLLYRINTVEIHIPPLRERTDDISLLAGHFLNLYAKKYRKGELEIQAEVYQKLRAYAWPGNVRELQHMVERAVILCEGSTIRPSDFHLSGMLVTDDSANQTLNLMENERRLILEAMDKYNGNISKVAEALGLTRAALYRRLEKHGIQ